MEFIYPVPPAPRTAVLVPWFRDRWNFPILMKQSIRVFPEGWGMEAARYQPAAIAGTSRQICALMPWRIPSLTHAVIVLARPQDKRLNDLDRDLFWSSFHVPVFEQIIGNSGELMAFECEAHDGLHLESHHTALTHETTCSEPCPCGRKTPRIGVTDWVESEHRIAACAR